MPKVQATGTCYFMDIPRIKSESGHVEPISTHMIPVAKDNLVCAICDARCTDQEWCIVSNPKRKGIMIVSCWNCIEKAKALLSKLL